MTKQTFFLAITLFIASGFVLYGQEPGESSFTPEKWAGIQQRWMRSQPVIMILTDSSAQYSGQPVHAEIDTLYFLPGTDFPVGAEWYSKVQGIPFSDIDRVLLQKGGNRFTRSRRSVSLVIPRTDILYTGPFQSIRVASVYSDSLVQARVLKDAFPHSKVLRQVFPKKHLRISFGIGLGGSNAIEDAEKALGDSPLPDPYYHQDRLSLDFLDVSWRFWDHYIVGGQLAARNFSYYLYGDNYGGDVDYYYNSHINFFENRLYAEYVFFPVDRFFTHRYELLAGAGLLMGKPDWSMDYGYNGYIEPEIWVFDETSVQLNENLYGFQLRSAFHFYLFPGSSLWAGVEANFYKPWAIQTLEFPTFDPDAPILLQEHTLDFSGVRIKFGVSIYL
jgi:hypothetical protein